MRRIANLLTCAAVLFGVSLYISAQTGQVSQVTAVPVVPNTQSAGTVNLVTCTSVPAYLPCTITGATGPTVDVGLNFVPLSSPFAYYLASNTTASDTCSHDTSFVTVWSFTIPSGTLTTAGSVVHVNALLDYKNVTSGLSLELKIIYGTTTIFDDAGFGTATTNASRRLAPLSFDLVSTGASAQLLWGNWTLHVPDSATSGRGDLGNNPTLIHRQFAGTGAEAANADKVLSVQISPSVNAADSCFQWLAGVATVTHP